MKSVINRDDNYPVFDHVSGPQIDANFEELEQRIHDREEREIEDYKLLIDVRSRVQALEAAGKSKDTHPEINIVATDFFWEKKRDAIRLEERRRVLKLCDDWWRHQSPPNRPDYWTVLRNYIIDGAEPKPANIHDDVYFGKGGKPMFTQADLDAAIEANNERAVRTVKRVLYGYKGQPGDDPTRGLLQGYVELISYHILNNDPAPEKK